MATHTQNISTSFSAEDVQFARPQDLGIKFKDYVLQVNALIQKQLDQGRPTVALRSLEKLKKQYAYSVLGCLKTGEKDTIIAHATLLPTDQIDSTISYNEKNYTIGELESVIVDTDLQIKGIGKALLSQIHREFLDEFSVVIMATLEPKMRHLVTKYFHYEDQNKLPHSFYQEGVKFFVDTGKMELEEFQKDGTSLIYFDTTVVASAKQYITELFLHA